MPFSIWASNSKMPNTVDLAADDDDNNNDDNDHDSSNADAAGDNDHGQCHVRRGK